MTAMLSFFRALKGSRSWSFFSKTMAFQPLFRQQLMLWTVDDVICQAAVRIEFVRIKFARAKTDAERIGQGLIEVFSEIRPCFKAPVKAFLVSSGFSPDP